MPKSNPDQITIAFIDGEQVDPWAWGDSKPATPLLDTIEYPVHLKRLKLPELRQLCYEIRADLIHTVSKVRPCLWCTPSPRLDSPSE